MKTKKFIRSFAGGEIAPELYGRLDLAKNQTGLKTSLNGWSLPHGPWQNRPGFEYVIHAKHPDKRAALFEFEFNSEQTFILEFGHQYIRWHTNGATLLEASQNITAISKANPGVLTYSGADPTNGQWFYLSGIGGMTELNGRYVKVANVNAGANTFELTDVLGNNINTTNYTTYTSGGTMARVYEISTTYSEDDITSLEIHTTQSADVFTLVHPDHPQRELRRLGATNWTLTDISFSPTVDAPTAVTASASPASGTERTRYKVTTLADDGLEESLASLVATVGAAVNISAATKANPCQVTANSHGRSAGDAILIQNVGGMTEINGEFLVNTVVDANNITLKTLDGVAVDSTNYTTYTSGGTLHMTDVVNTLSTSGNKNTVSWTAASDGVRYNVYKLRNGLYGYVGQTERTSFVDDNITADLTKTPAIDEQPFSGTGNYPGAVGYYEGRRCFAGTDNKPQNFWATRSGTESNVSYSIPTRDDDRIAFRIVARQANRIRHIVPLSSLILLTAGGEWKVAPQNSDILTPDSAAPKQINAEGASNVQPVIAGKNLLYVEDGGARLREMKTNQYDSAVYESNDISLMAPHLFNGFTGTDLAYVKRPYKFVFEVRSDGKLVGLTYLPEHEVSAWHLHETDGEFESIAAVREGTDYPLYAIVKRTINGQTVRYIERLKNREFDSQSDWFFVDAGVTVTSPSSLTIANGLWHLEGEEVAVLADGAVLPNATVTNGSITLELDEAPDVVHIGIPYTSDMELLPPALEADNAFGVDRLKNVAEVTLRVRESSNVKVGYDEDHLRTFPQRTNENYGTAPRPINRPVPVTLDGNWAEDAPVLIRQDQPVALTVAAVVYTVALGG